MNFLKIVTIVVVYVFLKNIPISYRKGLCSGHFLYK